MNPSRWRGEEASEGRIDKGKKADLVLLRSHPLTHISSTREIEAVILGGEYHARAKLDAMLRVTAEKVAASKRAAGR